jgi:hypothetical protein
MTEEDHTKLLRCVLNGMGKCLANIPEACLCLQMPPDVFEAAWRYFNEPLPLDKD